MNIISAFTAYIMVFFNIFCTIFGLPKYPTTQIDMNRFNETPIFAEEFDGASLNEDVWKVHTQNSSIRRGGYWDKEMASVENGNLHIKTQYLENGLNGNGEGWYTVGIDTRNSFNGVNYGYYECRCILPAGAGHWSAFWLTSDTMINVDGSGKDGAEIDIMESPYWNDENLKNTTIHTVHYDGYEQYHKSQNEGNWRISGDPYSQYHTYGLEWNEQGYTFYIDGKKTGQNNFGGASQAPEYIILSVEIGGENAVAGESWAGPGIETNVGGKDFTSDFIVDYVRVYSYK